MKIFAVLTFFWTIGLAMSEPPLKSGSNEKIIGGEDVSGVEYIWQVSLQRFGSHFCGGSLIAEGYVMSAAHCTVYQSGVTANMGSIEWKNPGQTISLSSFTAHPQYNDQTYDYDYSVATLASSATLNYNVGLIDLAEAGVEYPSGTLAIITGWGYIIRFPATIPDVLQVAYVVLISQQDCQAYWGSAIDITDRMQCVRGNGGASACMGDSGGPLAVVDSSTNSGYRLIGVASWASSTCSSAAPFAYAKISAVRSWIDSQISY